jgi:hypothetical protein
VDVPQAATILSAYQEARALLILTAASRRRLTCWCFSAVALRRTSKR